MPRWFSWSAIGVGSFAALVCEAWLGLSLSFAPGWANGWPFGLTIQAVWSAGMAVTLFLLLMTVAVGLGAALGPLLTAYGFEDRDAWRALGAWLLLCALLAALVCWLAYRGLYAEAWEMWPRGYNP